MLCEYCVVAQLGVLAVSYISCGVARLFLLPFDILFEPPKINPVRLFIYSSRDSSI
jgi:hypothetical protein